MAAVTVTPEMMEQAIECPAPGQAELFLEFEWLVPQVEEQWWDRGSHELFPYYHLFTKPVRVEPLLAENEKGREFAEKPYPLIDSRGEWRFPPMPHRPEMARLALVPMKGREIFARLAQTTDYHTVSINPKCGTYDQPRRHGCLSLACGASRLAARGLDPRLETHVLPARSIAEIHRYMGQHCDWFAEITHSMEYVGEELAAVYEGTHHHSEVVRQAFQPVSVAEPEPAMGYGEGPSPILCAASLAFAMEPFLRRCQDPREMPQVREHLYQSVPSLLRDTAELLKMVDAETGRIPPQYLHLPVTLGLIGRAQHLITREWILQARAGFEKYRREYEETR